MIERMGRFGKYLCWLALGLSLALAARLTSYAADGADPSPSAQSPSADQPPQADELGTTGPHSKGDESPGEPYESRTVQGWTVHVHKSLFDTDAAKLAEALTLLDVQLQRTVAVVPAAAVERLREVPIWINPPPEGKGAGAEYHPNRKWLADNGRNPAMAKAVELTNVAKFAFEDRRMPYLILHELAHAYHDRVLGFDRQEIIDVYKRARASGSYDEVQRFTGLKIVSDKAYALTNHKEYFAESTEAFFGKNDFFPFNREELQAHDPAMHDLLAELWKVEKSE